MRNKKSFSIGVLCVIVFYMSYCMYEKMMNLGGGDFVVHTNNAMTLEFSDLVTFLRRFTYPVYHVLTALNNRIFGISMYDAGVLVAVCFTVLTVVVTYVILRFFLEKDYSDHIIIGLTFILTFVTAIWFPWYNKSIYAGQSSPNIWHSPTQVVVKGAALAIIFLYVKYYYEYQDQIAEGENGIKIWFSWKKMGILSLLLFYSVLAKPSFLQAFLPAVMLFLLIELIISKGEKIFFCIQSAVAFLPSCLYLLYQFLFYYSSGSKYTRGGVKITFFGFVQNSAPNIVISSFLLYAFPVFVILFIAKKDIFKDKYLWMTILFAVVAFCESGCLAEAANNSAGNFSWAKQLSVYFLWVSAIIKYFEGKAHFDTLAVKHKQFIFKIGDILLAAHFISGICYYFYLLTTSAFA